MTSQYGAYALHAGLARLYARMRMHTPTRPGTHMHARTRKHAHTDKYVILIVFPQQQWFRERALKLRYTYIAWLVLCYAVFYKNICEYLGKDSSVGIATCYGDRRSGDRNPVGVILSVRNQTGPEAYPVSCTVGTGCSTFSQIFIRSSSWYKTTGISGTRRIFADVHDRSGAVQLNSDDTHHT